jgi:hypothetical protein
MLFAPLLRLSPLPLKPTLLFSHVPAVDYFPFSLNNVVAAAMPWILVALFFLSSFVFLSLSLFSLSSLSYCIYNKLDLSYQCTMIPSRFPFGHSLASDHKNVHISIAVLLVFLVSLDPRLDVRERLFDGLRSGEYGKNAKKREKTPARFVNIAPALRHVAGYLSNVEPMFWLWPMSTLLRSRLRVFSNKLSTIQVWRERSPRDSIS